MTNLQTTRVLGKARPTPFLKLYTADWIAGTLNLTFEEKGFYFELLARMWELKGPLPADDRWIASALCCNPRTVRKLIASLADKGKIQVVAGKVYNRRMMREITDYLGTSHAIEPEVEPNSTPIRPEFEPNAAKKQTKSKAPNPILEARIQKVEDSASKVSVNAAREDADELESKLLDACNGSLDNPVNCVGLLNLSVPMQWIESGADLERDVLPTLRAIGKKSHGRRIRSWDYFTNAVLETRDKRVRGLPPAPEIKAEQPKQPIVYDAFALKLREEAIASGWEPNS